MRLVKLSLFLSCLSLGLFTPTLGWAQAAPTALPTPAASAAPMSFSVAPGSSTVAFHIVHKLHKVDGASKKVEGKARVTPDGKAQVMVRIAADSFDSNNVNRDAKVKEVVEATKFPQIEIKASSDGLQPPASLPATVDKTFKVLISFHGIQKTMDVPIKLTFDNTGSVHAQATLTLSLDEFKIERPSLMFVKIDDEMKIDANLVFTKG